MMRFHHRLADRQPETGSIGLSMGHKRLKNLRQQFVRNSGAVIAHHEPDMWFNPFDRKNKPAALFHRHGFAGVTDKITENSQQPVTIRLERSVVIDLGLDLDKRLALLKVRL